MNENMMAAAFAEIMNKGANFAQSQQGNGNWATGQKNDPTSLTPVGPYAHGQFGLFSNPGQDAAVFSTILLPVEGIAGVLPVLNDADDSDGRYGGLQAEFFTLITGVTEGSEAFSDQPTEDCADGARAGLLKSGTIVSTYGRYRHSPNAPISLFRAGQRESIADPLTLRLMNVPQGGAFGTPTQIASFQNTVNNELAKRLLELAVSMRRFIAPRVYTGTPANNNGEARDITGLDLHVNTGNKVDAYTGQVLTAANSDIKDFGFDLVNGNGRDIMRYLEAMLAFLNDKSTRQGLGMWDGVIAMRRDAFEEIVKVVPIRAYHELHAEMARFTNSRLNVDAMSALNARNDMRDNRWLPLRGRRISVVIDDGIDEDDVTTNGNLIAGQYACDIYFIPLRVLGGSVPVTYWKMFDHTNEQAESIVRRLGVTSTFTSDGGFFRWYVNFKNGCVDMTVDWSPRLIMRTPQLAGRIQNVAYEPLQHFADYDPDSSYFTDGGRTNSSPQSYYLPWSISTPTTVP